MAEESTTPDLVELTRWMLEAFGSGDFDPVLNVFAPDGVYDMSALGMGTFEGHVAIRSLWEDWYSAYEEYENELEECQNLGGGVVFAVARQNARPTGGGGRVRKPPGFVSAWGGAMVKRVTLYYDTDEGRAAAERLVESRS